MIAEADGFPVSVVLWRWNLPFFLNADMKISVMNSGMCILKPEIRRQRMKETRNYSDEKVDSVMRNQQPDEVFFEQCSFVIKNNTTLSDVYAQLKEKLDQQ